jgi:two-component system LytT family sensor kinase
MPIASTIKRQFWVAAYTSPVVSVLAVTPVFMLGGSSSRDYPLTILFFTVFFFVMWIINIGLYFWLSRGQADAGPAWLRYMISYLISLFLTHAALYWMFYHVAQSDFHIQGAGFHFHIIVFLAVDTVLLILQDLTVTREKNAQLRIRNMEAMNMQLKQQIQPHFLFNSLSTLKSLITFSPELASEYLVRLSGFLRAAIAAQSVNLVRVERELDLCVDYLEMQRIRFGDALQFMVDVPAWVRSERYIPVFSLQLLVENAIKHNVLTVEQPLRISIDHSEEVITVRNNLQKKADVEHSAGTGLANLRERYKAFPGGGGIDIRQDVDHFSVGLKIFAHDGGDH